MRRQLESLSHFIHQRFIWLLIGSYLLAAVLPRLGLLIRSVSLGTIPLPLLLLGFLLFNAGLGVEVTSLRHLRRNSTALVVGLMGNLLIPIAFIAVVMHTMRLWHNSEEVQHILVGLALIASMPIAGSSTAWAQNALGNMSLSLGLVLFSTFLSPLTTPIALHSVGLMTTGDYSEDLHEIATAGTGWFLLTSVVVPSLLGIGVRAVLGQKRVALVRPFLRIINSIVLLLLNYSNAAISLPQAIASPDSDFLAVTLAITFALCAIAFGAGWGIARICKADRADTASLMFGLGMNNNGTGLVLASMALADHPQVLLPIILYNLVQHLIAGTVDHVMFRGTATGDSTDGEPTR